MQKVSSGRGGQVCPDQEAGFRLQRESGWGWGLGAHLRSCLCSVLSEPPPPDLPLVRTYVHECLSQRSVPPKRRNKQNVY